MVIRSVQEILAHLPWNELEKRRDFFLAARERIYCNDEEFLGGALGDATEVHARIAIVLRRVIARECGVPPEKLNPTDSTREIEPLMGSEGMLGWLLGGPYGYYFASVLPALAQELDRLVGTAVTILPKDIKVLAAFSHVDVPGFTDDPSFGHWVRLATQETLHLLAKNGVTL